MPGLREKVPRIHSTYGRVKVKTIQLFLGKDKLLHFCIFAFLQRAKNGHRAKI
jgi:hypothetical protein